MWNVADLSEYRKELERNLSVIKDIVNDRMSSIYPCLSKRLTSYRASCGKRLCFMLEYARNYGADDRQFISYDSYRGYECALSYDTMITQYGGSVETWYHTVRFFSSVGLLYVHKPDNHEKGNTPAQMYSVTRARERASKTHKKARSVNWYSFPRYSEKRLAEAEERCVCLQGISMSSMNKDALRDALGEKIANTAADTVFQMSPETEKEREVIKSIIAEQIERDGYTTPTRVLRSVEEKIINEPVNVDDDIFNVDLVVENEKIRKHIRWTWKAYQKKLFEGMQLVYSSPTGSEREAYKLSDKKWIIRHIKK